MNKTDRAIFEAIDAGVQLKLERSPFTNQVAVLIRGESNVNDGCYRCDWTVVIQDAKQCIDSLISRGIRAVTDRLQKHINTPMGG